MSRLQVPIRGRTLYTTGDVLRWIDLPLFVKDASGKWQRRLFRVDTGTEMTMISAYEAKQMRLPMPRNLSPGAVHAQTGLPFRSGYLRFRIAGMNPTEYVIPCLFLGDPDVPPDPSQPTILSRRLLQPFQLLDRLRFTFDESGVPAWPHGQLILEKR